MRIKPNPVTVASLLSVASVTLCAQHAQAADRIWSNATGTWDTVTANWSGAVFANGDNALFSASTANSAATLGATVNPLNFRSNGASTPATTTINGAAGFTLSLGSGIAGTGNVTAANGTASYEQNLTYAMTGAGSAFSLVAGSGTTLTPTIWNVATTKTFNVAANTVGQIADLNGNTVNVTGAGTVTISNGTTLKSTGGTGTFNANAGILQFVGGSSRNTTVENSITVNVAPAGRLNLAPNSGGGSVFGQIANLNGGTFSTAGGGVVSIPGVVTLGAGTTSTFTISPTTTLESIGGTGSANLTGGTLILANASTLSGGTMSSSGGTLQLNHANALGSDLARATGGGTILVNTGLTVNNAITLARSATGVANLNLNAGATWGGTVTMDNTIAQTTGTQFGAIRSNSTDSLNPGVVSGNIGFSTLGAANQPALVLRGTGGFGRVSGPVALSTGTLQLLDTSNWELNNASNTWGTLDIANAGAVVTVGAANTLSSGAVVSSTVGGTLKLNDQATTTAYSQTIAGLNGSVKVGLDTGVATLTLNTIADQTSSGVISGDISLVKTGPAKQTLTGFHAYTGSTTISAGTIALGTTGELGIGDLNINSATLDLRKGTATRSATVTNLSLTNATLDIGLNIDADDVYATGAVTVTGTNTLKLHGNIPVGTYPIITGQTSYTGGGSIVLDTSDAATGFTSYNGSKIGNEYVLAVSGTVTPAIAYWRGDVNSTWNSAVAAPNSNWATDVNGTTDTAQLPGATSDVFFSASNGANTSTTLGADFTIKSLTFESGTASVSGANMLSIAGVSETTQNGLDVLSGASASFNVGTFVNPAPSKVHAGGTLTLEGGGLGAGALTVDGTLNLNAATFTTATLAGAGTVSRSIAGTGALTVATTAPVVFGGTITNGAGTVSLTKSGTGSLTLSGASSYSGGTTASQADDTVGIIVGNSTALGSGPVLVNGAQNFSGSVSVAAGVSVNNPLTLKRGAGGSNRAILGLGANASWTGNITVDNTSANGLGIINAGGTDAATASIISGNIGFSTLGTGSSLVLRGQGVHGKVTGPVALSTGIVQLLDNSRYEFSNASNTWGTLDISNAGAIVTVGAANTLPATSIVSSTVGGTLRLNDQAGTTAYSQSIAGLNGLVNVGLTTGAATLTLNTATNQTTSGVISGAISVVKTGSANQTLTGIHTYTGNTTVNGAGALALADNAQLKFVIGANGVNNQISGTGLLELGGDLNVDLTGADLTHGNSWTLVTVGTLGETFLSSFQLVGFTETANVHKLVDGNKTWTFTESTGALTLSIAAGFDAWATSKGLAGPDAAFDADPDFDGLDNGLEFVLGGEPNPANPGANSAALLPAVAQTGGNMTFSFKRKDISESGVTLKFQWSTDLSFPSPVNDVPVGATDSTTDTITVDVTEDAPDADTDTIVITIPAAKAAGGKLFGRLSAVEVP
jgi:fibronectin-binding autotransporter adhesin